MLRILQAPWFVRVLILLWCDRVNCAVCSCHGGMRFGPGILRLPDLSKAHPKSIHQVRRFLARELPKCQQEYTILFFEDILNPDITSLCHQNSEAAILRRKSAPHAFHIASKLSGHSPICLSTCHAKGIFTSVFWKVEKPARCDGCGCGCVAECNTEVPLPCQHMSAIKIESNTWACFANHNGGEQKRFSVKLSPRGRFLLTGGRKEPGWSDRQTGANICQSFSSKD